MVEILQCNFERPMAVKTIKEKTSWQLSSLTHTFFFGATFFFRVLWSINAIEKAEMLVFL